MRLTKWRAALAGAAVLVGSVPLVASALAPPLTCRDVTTINGWQKIPVQEFQPIPGVSSTDKITEYSLASRDPGKVTVTNGKQIKVSATNGCSWSNGLTLGLQPTGAVPLSGTTSTIVSTATLPSGRVVAAVREGAGLASVPHIVASDDGRSGYRVQDSGLPPQGAPRVLRAANDGQTLYLAVTPTSSSTEDDGSGLPKLPDVNNPTTGAKQGLLYGSRDAGRTWELRTSAADLPGGGGGLDSLAVDRGNPDKIYAVSNGLLLLSRDGGANFSRVRVDATEEVTAVETFVGGFVIAFTKSGRALFSEDGRSALIAFPAPAGVTSAAFRGDPTLAVEHEGALSFVNLAGKSMPIGGLTVRPGSLKSDEGLQATYHALSGHSLVRYSDKPLPGDEDFPVAIDDLGAKPPRPGRIAPADRTVKLKVGDSTVVDYTLSLPKNPTPLDLMFLIDTSTSMDDYINNLKGNINKTIKAIDAAGIDLNVGLATLGTGSKADEDHVVGPSFDGRDPTGDPITLYKLFAKMSKPGTGTFGAALGKVKTKDQQASVPREAQLAALEQATAGRGIRNPIAGGLNPFYLVPPGQDAGWRQDPGVRRLIVTATDEPFDNPDGSPRKPDGSLDFDHTIALMNQYRVQQIGMTVGALESEPDLARIARGTHTLAPPDGADCGQDVVLRAGQPVVCTTTGDFSSLIGHLVSRLSDLQTVRLVARGHTAKVIRAIDATHLRSLDVTKPNTVTFKVAVTCAGISPGRYPETISAGLRNVKVATTRLTVECVGPAAVAAVAPPAAAVALQPPPPVVQAPAAVVPAPPAAQPQLQPQSQPQVQTQVNPMTAAALQQQEELQLALALQADEKPEVGEELAMVGHRHRDEGAALVLLAAAMAASASFGLARLRSRPDPAVVRVRR